LDRFDDRLTSAEVILVPALASFVMVMWDLCIDPASSTISGAWIWRDGGGYFGVPLVNFLGWYLCVFTIYTGVRIVFAALNRLDESGKSWRSLDMGIARGHVCSRHAAQIAGAARRRRFRGGHQP
jgi:putative membrane protein